MRPNSSRPLNGIRLCLFGPFELTALCGTVTDFRSDKTRALLAYLALEAGRPHRRAALAGLLWPDHSEPKALDNLRLTLHRLRRTLLGCGADPARLLEVTPKTIQFNLSACCELDVALFTRLLDERRQHSHPALQTCPACQRRLAQAAALYRGDLLQGFFLSSHPFEAWALVERERLRCQAIDALYQLADCAQVRGEYSLALAYAQRQLDLDPLSEEACRQAMQALARSGQRHAALRQYEAYAHRLSQDLGEQPAADTASLYERIRAAQA